MSRGYQPRFGLEVTEGISAVSSHRSSNAAGKARSLNAPSSVAHSQIISASPRTSLTTITGPPVLCATLSPTLKVATLNPPSGHESAQRWFAEHHRRIRHFVRRPLGVIPAADDFLFTTHFLYNHPRTARLQLHRVTRLE